MPCQCAKYRPFFGYLIGEGGFINLYIQLGIGELSNSTSVSNLTALMVHCMLNATQEVKQTVCVVVTVNIIVVAPASCCIYVCMNVWHVYRYI